MEIAASESEDEVPTTVDYFVVYLCDYLLNMCNDLTCESIPKIAQPGKYVLIFSLSSWYTCICS